ncbi:hypothetical protein HBB16_19255 [Pseudonocardia sp. MCCB 268]|nr:hypothetical protein [Pseudonocardia cytotoxica]
MRSTGRPRSVDSGQGRVNVARALAAPPRGRACFLADDPRRAAGRAVGTHGRHHQTVLIAEATRVNITLVEPRRRHHQGQRGGPAG